MVEKPLLGFSVLLGALASACGSAEEQISGPAQTLGLAAAAPTAEVTGSGHYHPAGQALRTFSFTVRRMPDGTVRGRFAGASHPPGGANRWSGSLHCLELDGNTAWIGGVYEHATNPALVGNGFVFKVVDNGEGTGTADYTSRAMRGGSDCTLRPEPVPEFWYPVEAGNIQIHH